MRECCEVTKRIFFFENLFQLDDFLKINWISVKFEEILHKVKQFTHNQANFTQNLENFFLKSGDLIKI